MTYPPAFLTAVAAVLEHEGGYVNDPRDNGGETKYGIAKRYYPKLDIANLTREQAVEIYWRDYWCRASCDRFPAHVAYCVFDAAVNQGVKTAIQMAQSVLGVGADGVVGNQTIAAASRAGERFLIDYATQRIVRYSWLDDFKHYGRGWIRRAVTVAMTAKGLIP